MWRIGKIALLGALLVGLSALTPAQVQVLLSGVKVFGSNTTWDPANKSATISLSGGNLIATSTAAVNQVAFATTSKTTGKFYFEITYSVLTNTGIGVADNTQPTNNFLGFANNSYGYFGNGQILHANALLTTIASFTVGSTVSVAFDMGNQKVWFRPNCGLWDNSATDNPATNTGGFATWATATFPAVSPNASGETSTVNFGQKAFKCAVPTGFTALP